MKQLINGLSILLPFLGGSNMQLVVSEIKASLQGEGKYTGYPTTFVRLFGCNLRCKYCDTLYALNGRKKRLSINTVLTEIGKLGNKYICITGGEPLIQESVFVLVYELIGKGYIVTIETNGAVALDRDESRSYSYCMDVKCPSSGESDKNILDNLDVLLSHDEVKFVIYDYKDYQFAVDTLKKYKTKASVIFSPCFVNGKSNADQIADWMIEDKIPNARLGVQMHRVIGIY